MWFSASDVQIALSEECLFNYEGRIGDLVWFAPRFHTKAFGINSAAQKELLNFKECQWTSKTLKNFDVLSMNPPYLLKKIIGVDKKSRKLSLAPAAYHDLQKWITEEHLRKGKDFVFLQNKDNLTFLSCFLNEGENVVSNFCDVSAVANLHDPDSSCHIVPKPIGFSDNTCLPFLDSPNILYNIFIRYIFGYIYTYTGKILICVNPYKWTYYCGCTNKCESPHLPNIVGRNDHCIESNSEANSNVANNSKGIRSDEVYIKENYVDKIIGDKRVHPHPFALGETAYKNVTRYFEPQAIVITGNSGGGKTETAKMILQYIAFRLQEKNDDKKNRSTDNFLNQKCPLLNNNEINEEGTFEDSLNKQKVLEESNSQKETFLTIEDIKSGIYRADSMNFVDFVETVKAGLKIKKISDLVRRKYFGELNSDISIDSDVLDLKKDSKWVFKHPIGMMSQQCSSLLSASTILESFGNAKTILNYNSSRFGRLSQIYFISETNDSLVAKNSNKYCFKQNNLHLSLNSFTPVCATKAYLLEIVRVVRQNAFERNFHIFYQLLRGCDPDFLALFSINADEYQNSKFHILNSTNSNDDVTTTHDFLKFENLCRSFESLDFDITHVISMFGAIIGVLHLGNIDFQDCSKQGIDYADIGNETYTRGSSLKNSDTGFSSTLSGNLNLAAVLLGFDASSLRKVLTIKAIRAGSEKIFRPRTSTQGQEVLYTLIKSIYKRLFFNLVASLNQHKKLIDLWKDDSLFIGILDIYGFENLPVNTFEQLCINYANERLQLFFVKRVLLDEQGLYQKEGVFWKPLEVTYNTGVVGAIQGIVFSKLDDSCRLRTQGQSKQSDDDFYGNVVRSLDGSPSVFKSCITVPRQGVKNERIFLISHYAGSVTYEVDGWVNKNNDQLATDIEELLCSTTNSAISKIGAIQKDGSRLVFKSISKRFQEDVEGMLMDLSLCNMQFIRCINPNVNMAPFCFDGSLVLQQLVQSGTIDMVRIMHKGYPTRFPYKSLVPLIRSSLPERVNINVDSDRSLVECTMAAFDIPRAFYYCGVTMLFLKGRVFYKLSEIIDSLPLQMTEGRIKRFLELARAQRCRRVFVTISICIWIEKTALKQTQRKLKLWSYLSEQMYLRYILWRYMFEPLRRRAKRKIQRKKSLEKVLVCVNKVLVKQQKMSLDIWKRLIVLFESNRSNNTIGQHKDNCIIAQRGRSVLWKLNNIKTDATYGSNYSSKKSEESVKCFSSLFATHKAVESMVTEIFENSELLNSVRFAVLSFVSLTKALMSLDYIFNFKLINLTIKHSSHGLTEGMSSVPEIKSFCKSEFLAPDTQLLLDLSECGYQWHMGSNGQEVLKKTFLLMSLNSGYLRAGLVKEGNLAFLSLLANRSLNASLSLNIESHINCSGFYQSVWLSIDYIEHPDPTILLCDIYGTIQFVRISDLLNSKCSVSTGLSADSKLQSFKVSDDFKSFIKTESKTEPVFQEPNSSLSKTPRDLFLQSRSICTHDDTANLDERNFEGIDSEKIKRLFISKKGQIMYHSKKIHLSKLLKEQVTHKLNGRHLSSFLISPIRTVFLNQGCSRTVLFLSILVSNCPEEIVSKYSHYFFILAVIDIVICCVVSWILVPIPTLQILDCIHQYHDITEVVEVFGLNNKTGKGNNVEVSTEEVSTVQTPNLRAFLQLTSLSIKGNSTETDVLLYGPAVAMLFKVTSSIPKKFEKGTLLQPNLNSNPLARHIRLIANFSTHPKIAKEVWTICTPVSFETKSPVACYRERLKNSIVFLLGSLRGSVVSLRHSLLCPQTTYHQTMSFPTPEDFLTVDSFFHDGATKKKIPVACLIAGCNYQELLKGSKSSSVDSFYDYPVIGITKDGSIFQYHCPRN